MKCKSLKQESEELVEFIRKEIELLRSLPPEEAKARAQDNLIRSGLAEIVDGEFRIKQLIQEKYYDRRSN